jgi:hypothetical protein
MSISCTFATFGPIGGGVKPDGQLLVGVDGSTDPNFNTLNVGVVALNTSVAPPAVQAFVQGANDTIFSAENVALNAGSYTGTPSPVVDSAGITDVFLQGANGHLYASRQLATGWTAPVDITAPVTGAPNIESSPEAVMDGTTLHVFALAAGSNDLIDYHNDGSGQSWLTTDLTTTDPGAPSVAPSLSAVLLGGTLHVYTTSASGALVEVDNDNQSGHAWNFYNESASAGGGVPIAGAPGPLLINGTPHVYTRAGKNGDLVEFVADHAGGHVWNAYDQTKSAPGSPTLSGNPIPTLIGGIPHVYVDDGANGDLVEFVADHLAGRIWNSYDQTVGADAPPLTGNPSVVLVDGTPYGQPGTMVPEVFENAGGALGVVAADHQFGDIWNAYDATELSGGSPITSDPTVVLNGPFVEVLALTSNQSMVVDSAKVRAQRSAPATHVANDKAAAKAVSGLSSLGRFEQFKRLEQLIAP